MLAQHGHLLITFCCLPLIGVINLAAPALGHGANSSQNSKEEALTKEAVAEAERLEAEPQQQAALEPAKAVLSAPVQGADACLRMTESDDLAAAQLPKCAEMPEQQARASARQVSPGAGYPQTVPMHRG
jgi:hypothetical protein